MRFFAFDGLRGCLSLLVVLSHFPGNAFLHGTLFARTGGSLIDLFFVFSGFVIVAAFERPLGAGYGTGRFLIERFGRLYPIHLAMLLLFIVTELLIAPLLTHYGAIGRHAFEGANSIAAIFTNLTMIHAFGVYDGLTWNYPSWSLSTEWGAYLFFAVAMMLSPRRFWPLALAGIVVSAAILFFLAPKGMHSTYDYGVFRSIYGFCAGAIAFYIFHSLHRRGALGAIGVLSFTLLEIATLAMMLAVQMGLGTTQAAILIPLTHMIVLVVFACAGGAVSTVLSSKPLVYLGTISLSVYVVHAWILLRLTNVATAIERMTGYDLVAVQLVDGAPTNVFVLPPMVLDGLALATIAAVVVISHFTYRYIELPGQAMFRRLAKRVAGIPPRQTAGPSQPASQEAPALNATGTA